MYIFSGNWLWRKRVDITHDVVCNNSLFNRKNLGQEGSCIQWKRVGVPPTKFVFDLLNTIFKVVAILILFDDKSYVVCLLVVIVVVCVVSIFLKSELVYICCNVGIYLT